MSLAYYILDPNILLSLGTIKVFTISLNDPSLLFFKFMSVSFTFCSRILLPGWLVDNVPASASSSLSFAHSLQAENPDKRVQRSFVCTNYDVPQGEHGGFPVN